MKDGFNTSELAKNNLRAFVFNVLDFDDKRLKTDNKKIQRISDHLQNKVTRKPDKGEGVVTLNQTDNKMSMDPLFTERKRFHIIKKDPTP